MVHRRLASVSSRRVEMFDLVRLFCLLKAPCQNPSSIYGSYSSAGQCYCSIRLRQCLSMWSCLLSPAISFSCSLSLNFLNLVRGVTLASISLSSMKYSFGSSSNPTIALYSTSSSCMPIIVSRYSLISTGSSSGQAVIDLGIVLSSRTYSASPVDSGSLTLTAEPLLESFCLSWVLRSEAVGVFLVGLRTGQYSYDQDAIIGGGSKEGRHLQGEGDLFKKSPVLGGK